ncbi:single-stranded-DNA-specific exonuclease RecJ [Methylocapsa palsarum]|uniref:Single-stranded-DNA-specific exonuclease RecJ n=1 Tax=Methylocapsa palsarum TaxID=1612308 RepID=A0A1I4BVR3_9HYPH|nr:single-stranded-DNA-specific exonuclease RecJ [Methylocapsa palsarum]SFK72898.1 single-stranded-DNA-specific exonuclease [Methylocapsa palsarum]
MTESPHSRPPAFLGVERSVTGRPWRDRLDEAGQSRALAISQLLGAGDLVSRVLAGRGITPDQAEEHLDPTLRRLMPDPFVLIDMEAAAGRIADAVQRGDKIAIFGDYDVDGAASSALLADYFFAVGAPYVIHIPDRIFEGYGPNVEAIQNLAQSGARLLITVDCGTMSHGPLAEADKLGLDPIVLDHHSAPETLPDALVVNPNRQDDLSGLGQLCAAGVVFMTLVAVNRILRARNFFGAARIAPDLLAGLDLVALATIADVAPLTGLNRAFVTKGLSLMRTRGRPGLTALFDVAQADGPPSSYHLGFLVGPRINAGGRVGDAALGARLLSLKDPLESRRVAEELDRLNRERQDLERGALEEAEANALATLGLKDQGAAVVVSGEEWHPGVVGLVAARLKEKYRRPAFAISFFGAGEFGTGSGRSIPGVDLGRAVRAAVEAGILVKGGGHAMAAGLTIGRRRVDDFRAFLEDRLARRVEDLRAGESLLIDAALTAGAASPALMAALDRAGPFGAGNAEPVFVFPAHRLLAVADVGNGHVRLRAQSGDGARIDGIAFRAGGEPLGRALHAGRGTMTHLAGTLSLDSYGGRERVRLRLLDLAPAARPRQN